MSMDRTDPFWEDIGLRIQPTQTLKEIARSFVQSFQNVEEYLCRGGRVSKEGQHLFLETYEQIVSEVGKDIAEMICIWGTKTVSEDEYYPLVMAWWEKLLLPLSSEQETQLDVDSLALPLTKIQELKKEIMNRRKKLDQILSAIDKSEEQPMSESETYIYQLYNKDYTSIPPREVKIRMSPLNRIYSEAEFVKAKTIWEYIVKMLGNQELEIFVNWAKIQAGILGMDPNQLGILLAQ